MPEQLEMQIGKTPVYLVKDNTSCTIIPEVPGLRELLSFVQKDLVPKPDLFFSNGKVYKLDAERNIWKLRGKEYLDSDGAPFDPVTQTAMQGTRKRGRGNEVVRKTVHAYNEIPNPSYKVLQTYQGLWRKVRDWLVQQGHPVTVHSDCTPIQPPQLNLMRGFRFSQQALTYELLIKEESGLLCAPTRYGKCFGKGTPVLMADWTIKAVEDVRAGDLVMGPDSKPRKVAGCTRGTSELFQVTPNYNGMTWICNADHELHVQRTCEERGAKLAGTLENVAIREWLNASPWFRHVRKQRSVALDHKVTQLPLDPYIYGVWLGDGHSDGITFTNAEPEVWSEIEQWAVKNNLVESLNTQQKGKAQTRRWVLGRGAGSVPKGANKLRQWLLAGKKNQGIRAEFIKTDRAQRLELLAGLLDTDGESNGISNCGFVSKHEKLARDVVFLCQSLGFGAACHPCWKQAQTGPKRRYWRVGIRGATEEIPFRVPRKKRSRSNKFNCRTVGFEVEPIGVGDYYGFALEDPEGLFLLGDCTVVHNTTIIKNVLRAYPGVNTVVTVPGDDVLEQLYQDIKAAMPKRNVVKLGGSKSAKGPSDDITVCSMDSLHRCDHLHTRLLLVDEPHSAVTDSRMPEFQKFVNARKLGFGATLDGRFDGRDMLIEGVIGPVLANRTYTEAVAEGAIAPIRVLTLKVPFKDFPVKTRQGAYNRLVFNNYELNSTINELLRQVVPQDMQALVFINNEKQAEGMLEVCGAPNVIAMAKKMTSAQRTELVGLMKTNQISRCIASNIFSTGVTFSDLAVVVMAAGGGGSISAIQKPGRIAEVRPGKKYGFVIDFLRQCTDPEAKGAETAWQTVIRDDQARLDTYRAKGYEVTVCEDIEELNKLFQQCL